MSEHEALIANFYRAFGDRDYKTMQQSYHPDAVFSDPVFTTLHGDEIGRMWEMLATTAKDLRIEAENIAANGNGITCRWHAWYPFSRTGREVHNIVNATFVFQDGKILRHTDNFDFYRWSRQALGLTGVVLGWTPFLQNKVRETAARSLKNFIQAASS